MLSYHISMAHRPVSDFRGTGPFAVSEARVLSKPRLRGWIHLYCAYAALVAGSALVAVSWSVTSTRAGHATLAYTLAIVAMFTVSATYHRVSWGSTAARNWMRRLDHSMIFVFIAGTYTPFARLDMPPSTGHQVLAIVWGGALAGVALTLFWPDAPRWLSVALYLLLGWVAVSYAGGTCTTRAWPQRYCSQSAAHFTALVRCFTHYAGPTPGLSPSVITRYFTR